MLLDTIFQYHYEFLCDILRAKIIQHFHIENEVNITCENKFTA